MPLAGRPDMLLGAADKDSRGKLKLKIRRGRWYTRTLGARRRQVLLSRHIRFGGGLERRSGGLSVENVLLASGGT